jgi:imidazoleglycerol-phosphate dehydratase
MSTTPRVGTIHRETRETNIRMTLAIDPTTPALSEIRIKTPLPFLNHMLNTIAVHGQFGLEIDATGDIEVDPHHLVEDVGIVLGQCVIKALGGGYTGIQRAGCFSFPMDQTLATVALDLCGRSNFVWKVGFESMMVGHLDPRLFREFFKGLTDGLQSTVHIHVPYQDNDHHVIEAIFKAFARSLRQALTPLQRSDLVMSTKGVLEIQK